MTLSIKHSYVSSNGDPDDPTLIGETKWNDDHTLSGFGTAAGMDVGTGVQAYSANLDSWALVAPGSYLTVTDAAASYQPLDADLTTWASLTPSANFQTMVPHTFAQMRSDLGLVIGTNVQAWNADLDTWATKTAPTGTVLGNDSLDTDGTLAANSDSKIATQKAVKTYADQLIASADAANPNYATIADAEAASIPTPVLFVRTAGYYAAGDNGGALYKRAGSEPSHIAKFQDALSNWWEMAEAIPNLFQFGAKGDNSTDDYAAIQGALDSGWEHILAPPATYKTSAELQMPTTHPVLLDGGTAWPMTIIVATATMRSVIYRGTDVIIGGGVRGINFEAAKLANYAIKFEAGKSGIYEDCQFTNAIVAEGEFGNDSTPRWYENKIIGCAFYTSSATFTDPDDRPDYNVRTLGYATDHEFIRCTFANAKTANHYAKAGGNALIACHAYGSPGTYEATYCYQSDGPNRYIGCYCDGFGTAGIYLNSSGCVAIGTFLSWPSTTTADGILVASGLSNMTIEGNVANPAAGLPSGKSMVAFAGTQPTNSQVLDGVVYSDGKAVIVGANASPVSNARFNVVGTDFATTLMNFARFSADNQSSFFQFLKSRGTTANTHAIVSTSDIIGVINFAASDGSAYRNAAAIRGVVSASPGSSDMPGALVFMTTPDGSATLSQRAIIDHQGRMGINETAPDYLLDINGAIGFTPGSSVTPVDNGDVVFQLTSNTSLTIKAKGSDGTVRSVSLTLS